MKRKPVEEFITVLYRATAQAKDAIEVLEWYLAAGNEPTAAEWSRLAEARTQLTRLLVN